MRISHFTALVALAASAALGGCVAAAPSTTTTYGYNYPYYSSYTVSNTYPYGYTAPFSTDYNGSYNTYGNDAGNGQ